MNKLRTLALVVVAFALPLAAHAAHPVKPANAPAEPPDAGPTPVQPVAATPPPAAPEPAPSHGPVAPAGKPADAPKKPVGAAPQLPPELQPKPPPVEKKIENPAEVTYRQKAGEHAFALRVRPGAPKPGDTLELILDLAKLHDPPDPVVGDREPARDEDLVITLEKGKSATRVLHALAEPGRYGAHFTLSEGGLYTVRISRRSGKPGVDASFPLGVGVATPVRPDDVAATLTPTGHGPLRVIRPEDTAPDGSPKAAMPQVMRLLGEKLLALDAQVSSGKGDAAATARAMAELAKALPGQTPPFGDSRPREFDQAASDLTAALTAFAASPSAAKLATVEQNQCWKCHAQFRWGVASDTAGWPSFAAAKEVK
ncbi:MAG: hypothetical protein JST54_24350 [Deltaproteobacteria bacterium]|nr:hypothetical protein [Deltaproteobacteria bacterium]